MSGHDVVAIGTSAGGVEALRFLVAKLPEDLAASILITIHLPANFRSSLDDLLTESGPLQASFATDGEQRVLRHIYLAPPAHHLLLYGDTLRLGNGPRENHARPAIDPMFRSVALCCGHRAIGVVMTGLLGDGASGLWAIRQGGGLSVVQDPSDAAFAAMPHSALDLVHPDHVSKLAELPNLLARLVASPAAMPQAKSKTLGQEVEVAKGRRSTMGDMDRIGRRSAFVCPECNGVMWEIDEGDIVRFRCHVGHAYTAELMGLALDENLRRSLATAQRAVEERVALAEKLQKQALDSGRDVLAESWALDAREFASEAEVIRESVRRIDDLVDRIAEVELEAK